MIDILSGRIETSSALPMGPTRGKQKSRFVFSALEDLDTLGRYKVSIHDWLPKGLAVQLRVSDVDKVVRFNIRSFQTRFQPDNLTVEKIFEAVLRAKVNLLKERGPSGPCPGFTHLLGLLYLGPQRSLSAPSPRALAALVEYSQATGKSLRLSHEYFKLDKSFTIDGSFIAIDVKTTLETGTFKLKKARLPDGREIVRRIDDWNPRIMTAMTRFRNIPHVMPTLATAHYVNKKERDIFVSYHPYFKKNLHQFLGENRILFFNTQLTLALQILSGMYAINKEGVHGNLTLFNIFIGEKGGLKQVFIGGLERISEHGQLYEPIKDEFSPPEIWNSEGLIASNEKHDVWQLGTLFQTLFQREIETIPCFYKKSQDSINSRIEGQQFPPPIAAMIQGMLRVDPVERWSLKRVISHFNKEVLEEFGHLIQSVREGPLPPALEALQNYAKKHERTIHFSAGYFQLKSSVTATPDLVVVDIKNSQIPSHLCKIKLSNLSSGERIVRRISRYDPKMVKILSVLQNGSNLLPTLGMARYTNKKGEDVLVSYHPYFEDNLSAFLCKYKDLTYREKLNLAADVLTGISVINQKGFHGYLSRDAIFISPQGRAFIAGLERFTEHGKLYKPIKGKLSAPEIRNSKGLIASNEKEDVWQLGTFFRFIFQKKINYFYNYNYSSQDIINSDIQKEQYPPPIAVMIEGMLQVDPVKRWSLERVINHFNNEVLQVFEPLIQSLRDPPLPTSAVEALQNYAKKYDQIIRFSAGYFELKSSVTATPNLVAIDIKKSLIAKNNGKIKLSMLPDGTKVVRRSAVYDSKMVKILTLFRNKPRVLPTLSMARYTNKKGEDILVSYHPLFDMDLFKALMESDLLLDFKRQVHVCKQIISGLKEIHKLGTHGDLYLKNILINTNGYVVISDLESFKPHHGSRKEWGRALPCPWSPPEVRGVADRPYSDCNQDVWSLGLIFHCLFQKSKRKILYFDGCTQEEIRRDIINRDFPSLISRMLFSMLQINPAERVSLDTVSEYFEKNFL